MVTRTERLEFTNSAGVSLAGRLEWPAGTVKAFAVFAHCFTCGANVHAATRIARGLAGRGIAVLRFDFTGLGNSEGDFANTNFSSNIEDLVAAAEHLTDQYEAPQLLVGHSLGGAAVLMAAGRLESVEAVAVIGAPSDPQHVERLLQDDLDTIESSGTARVKLAGREFTIKRQFLQDLRQQQLTTHLRKLRKAVLIYHSPVDEVVDIDNARVLYEAAVHPKSFLSLDRADHLLSQEEDSGFVAATLCAWASRYVEKKALGDPALEHGEIVVEELGRGFLQSVRSDRHEWVGDEPESAGGLDLGPTPYDLLLSALGTCTNMTLRMYAKRKEWPLQTVKVLLRHQKIHAKDCEECESETGKVDRIERVLTLSGELDDDQRQRLLEIADRCPVHRTLTGEKEIVTVLAEDSEG